METKQVTGRHDLRRISKKIGRGIEDEFYHGSEREQSIREKAATFSKVVSLVGLRHAVDRKNSTCRRFIWILWLLFGCGFAVYQIQDCINIYISYPIKTEIEIVDVQQLRFPQVTICAISKFRCSNKRLAHALFAGENVEEVPHLYGEWIPCIRFGTAGKELLSNKPGLEAGLRIYLRCKQHKDARADYHFEDVLLEYKAPGFMVLIHEPSVNPSLTDDQSFIVPFGSAAHVSISLNNFTYLGLPYSDCKDQQIYKYTRCIEEMGHHSVSIIPSADISGKTIFENFNFGRDKSSSENLDPDSIMRLCPQCHQSIYRYTVTQSEVSKSMMVQTLEHIWPDVSNYDKVGVPVRKRERDREGEKEKEAEPKKAIQREMEEEEKDEEAEAEAEEEEEKEAEAEVESYEDIEGVEVREAKKKKVPTATLR